MSGRTVHVVGAGLAGLSAAVSLAERGARVVLHESARSAGGRCRSYHDAGLGLTIDNGNHLLLSGNRAALAYVDRIGGRAALHEAPEAAFDFADLGTGERWRLRPNSGRIPWWLLSRRRRVPGTRAADYLAPLRLFRARPETPIGEVMACRGPLYERLWRPVLLAALNTEPHEAASGLAVPVLRETLGSGGAACRPIVATGGLSAAFIDPALDLLRRHGAEIRTGARLRALDLAPDGRVSRLRFGDAEVGLAETDGVVLAVPPWISGELLPGIEVPDDHRGILNAHFRIPPPAGTPLLVGLVGSLSEWLFAYPDRLSVTVSAGDRHFDTPREELAATIWSEVAGVTGLGPALPPWQIVKERRATFAATPAQMARRPKARTVHDNLVLAGDWTDTGLPGTIEGAIRSGQVAASVLQSGDGQVSHPMS